MSRLVLSTFLLAALAVFGWFAYPPLRLRFGHVDFQELKGDDRLALARWRKGSSARAACRDAGLAYPPGEIFLRAFKQEGRLELWGRDGSAPFTLIRSYPVLSSSGAAGPKRREGDRQVPEGFYEIDRFNPESAFHLSLGLNYPNASDRLRSDPNQPGCDIFIHGGDLSIGCLPLGDDNIEELFLIAWEARQRGQRAIAVQIYPAMMQGAAWEAAAGAQPALKAFWDELQPGFDFFERRRQLPVVTVGTDGRYEVAAPPAP